MALTSAGGGDDRLQVGMAVFAIVISLMVTMMIPVVAPSYEQSYSYEDVYNQKAAVQAFTGESMTNQSPWVLQGVYTPYIEGLPYGVSEEGWLYGTAITDKSGYQYIGETSGIKLDPDQKSNVPLIQEASEQSVVTDRMKWYYKTPFSDSPNFFFMFSTLLGFKPQLYEVETKNFPTWSYSGYRYEFDPMLMINTQGDEQKIITADDAKLSIVWYETYGQEGISGGLVLYSQKTRGIVANYTANEIIANYNVNSSFSSKYLMDFDGTKIYLHVKFDTDVLTGDVNLSQAWTDGRWSLAFTATSAGSLMDIKNSNNLSTSIGNILETYIDIFTFSLPEAPAPWSMILWVICILPVEVVVMMFLSRFGIAGLGMGILGNVMLGIWGAL